MGLTVVEVKGAENFYSAIAPLEKNSDLFVLFLADTDPETGLSWCPDTVRADPIIMETFRNTAKSTTLVRVYVGDRPTWKDPNHPFRHDPKIMLTGVPTLMRWQEGPVEGSILGDSEAHLPELIKTIIG
eukprot:TRINITY_DN1881_c0_g1_i1.p2 TRINITY_DN1881_c0_g1~~TRINITY_DN1881_c0_g1_i1.p2  ORF type:complete len:129 (+),score=16.20 TRINITY_DN1881_c0_g1_i1:258-644(+)